MKDYSVTYPWPDASAGAQRRRLRWACGCEKVSYGAEARQPTCWGMARRASARTQRADWHDPPALHTQATSMPAAARVGVEAAGLRAALEIRTGQPSCRDCFR